MRLLLLALVGLGVWLLIRRRQADDRRVVVAWDDGSDLVLRHGSPARDRLASIAQEALS
jgi:hypothetical protein